MSQHDLDHHNNRSKSPQSQRDPDIWNSPYSLDAENCAVDTCSDIFLDHDYTELTNLSVCWPPLSPTRHSSTASPLSPFITSVADGSSRGSSSSWTSEDSLSLNCENVFEEDDRVSNSYGLITSENLPQPLFDEESQENIKPLNLSIESITDSPNIELLADEEIWRRHKIPKNRKKPGRKPGQVSSVYHLWEYLVDSLFDPEMNPPAIKWTERHKGVFQINDTKELSKKWGMIKKNKNMTYEKMSRALRHSIKVGYLQRVPKKMGYPKKLCYMFGPKAHGWNADISKYMETEELN